MVYILLSVVLMSLDQNEHYVPRIRNVLEAGLEPVFRAVGWPARALRSLDQFTRSRQALIGENRQLQQRQLQTAAALQTRASLERENQRLRDLLDATRGRQNTFQFAEMIRVDQDPFSHRVWIDRGVDAGATVGQAVIDGLGVVGQIEAVHRHSATVRLISDPDHALPVQINRTGLRTVAFGTGRARHLLMPNVPLQADVGNGDLIVTSGLGDRFPPGFPVGEVERVERDQGASFATVYVRPFAALDRGRELLLVEPRDVAAPVQADEP